METLCRPHKGIRLYKIEFTITIMGNYSSFAKDVFKYNNSELKTIFVPRLPSGKDMEVFCKAIDKVKVL